MINSIPVQESGTTSLLYKRAKNRLVISQIGESEVIGFEDILMDLGANSISLKCVSGHGVCQFIPKDEILSKCPAMFS